jgi:periplasmic copper chaperone A
MTIGNVLALIAAAGLVFASAAQAHQVKTTTLIITHPWVHGADAGAAFTDGFMTIRNVGKEPERLLGAVIDGVGEAMVTQAGPGKGMCKLAKGIEIAPGATLELKPGRAGLLFGAVSKPLREALYADGVLNFAKAGAVKVEFFVEAAGAQSSGHAVLAECEALPVTQ